MCAAAAAVSQQQQRSKVEAAVNAGHGLSGLIPERQRSPSSSSSSNGSLVKSELKSPPASPILNHNNNCQPVDLSSKSDGSSKKSPNENSPSNGSSNASNADFKTLELGFRSSKLVKSVRLDDLAMITI